MVTYKTDPQFYYEVEDKIGEGASSEVFLARNKIDKKMYALKKIQIHSQP